MDKEDIHVRLDDIYDRFEGVVDDESISSFSKAYQKVLDELGSIISELEDEIRDDKLAKEEGIT